MDGWIKLHRKLIDWEWYQDTNVKVVFLHLLLTANHEDKKWQGITIKRGQLVTSYGNLAKSIGLTAMQVRTAINKLKLTSEITSKVTNKYTLITIENFDLYQTREENLTSKITSNLTVKQQANNKQITTNKNIKKYKNIKNNKNISTAAIEFWQNNLGELTPHGLEILQSYLEDFDEEVLIYAMQIAAEKNVRTIAYVKGILDSWLKKDLKNLIDIKNEKKKVSNIRATERNYTKEDYARLYANS